MSDLAAPDVARPATDAGERPAALPLLLIVAQLAGVCTLLVAFGIEGARGLPRVAALVVLPGFVLHALLPLRYRPATFLAISLAAFVVVLGAANTAAVAVLGAALIGICHLPMRYRWRVGLLLAAGAGFAGARSVVADARPWVLFGSMFMFRLILYMYNLPHEPRRIPLAQRLSYFFLLPNAVFPLFPVIDSTALQQRWYQGAAIRVYQSGITWLVHGVSHLLVYRLVYHHLALAPAQVQDVGTLVRYMTASYLLYLRVSGMFHIVVGLLALFGYDLPRTHDHYFLASSFSDLWRRINIYWKQFVQKLVFMPLAMRFRERNLTAVTVAATLVVFVASWVLHSWQWFWLRGTFPLTAQDAVFWCGLGGCVAVNAAIELRRTRRPAPAAGGRSWGPALGLSVRTLAMFTIMSVLWSLWSSNSLAEWVALWRLTGPSPWRGTAGVLAAALCLLAFGTAAQVAAGRGWELGRLRPRPTFGRAATVSTASIALLFALAAATWRWAAPPGMQWAQYSLRADQLNTADQARLTEGYYQGLLNVRQVNSPLWTLQKAPEERVAWIKRVGGERFTFSYLGSEMVPDLRADLEGVRFTTNHWGMRDRPYPKAKPRGTYRIALLGGSEVMGSGVDDAQIFEPLLEARLNREPLGPYAHLEILNFSMVGYWPVQRLLVLEPRVFEFAPDAVLYVGHDVDGDGNLTHVATKARFGFSPPYPWLAEILERAGVTPGTSIADGRQRLAPWSDSLLAATYRAVREAGRARGTPIAWVYLPGVNERWTSASAGPTMRLARDAGLPVIDLSGVYLGQVPESLRVTEWDQHPNARAHRLIADRLYTELQRPETRRLMGWSP